VTRKDPFRKDGRSAVRSAQCAAPGCPFTRVFASRLEHSQCGLMDPVFVIAFPRRCVCDAPRRRRRSGSQRSTQGDRRRALSMALTVLTSQRGGRSVETAISTPSTKLRNFNTI